MPLSADTAEIERTLKALGNPVTELRMISSNGKFKKILAGWFDQESHQKLAAIAARQPDAQIYVTINQIHPVCRAARSIASSKRVTAFALPIAISCDASGC